jgi:hypothetical protein
LLFIQTCLFFTGLTHYLCTLGVLTRYFSLGNKKALQSVMLNV